MADFLDSRTSRKCSSQVASPASARRPTSVPVRSGRAAREGGRGGCRRGGGSGPGLPAACGPCLPRASARGTGRRGRVRLNHDLNALTVGELDAVDQFDLPAADDASITWGISGLPRAWATTRKRRKERAATDSPRTRPPPSPRVPPHDNRTRREGARTPASGPWGWQQGHERRSSIPGRPVGWAIPLCRLIGLTKGPVLDAQSRHGGQVAVLADDGAMAEGQRDGRDLQVHLLDDPALAA